MLFGYRVEGFRSVGWAFVSCFKTLVGTFNYDELAKASPYVAPIYFVVFAITFFLVLLNMFVSIISVHYEEVTEELESEDTGSGNLTIRRLIENELQRKFNAILTSMAPERDKLQSEEDREQFKLAVAGKLPLTYRIFARLVGMTFVLSLRPDNADLASTAQLTLARARRASLLRGPEVSEGANEGTNKSDILRLFYEKRAQKRRLLQQNAIAGRRDEEEDALVFDKGQPAFWASTLEEMLGEGPESLAGIMRNPQKSKIEIEFYPRTRIDGLTQRAKNFVFASRRSRLQLELWAKADLRTKYEYWCGLDAMHAEYADRSDNSEEADDEEAKKPVDSSSAFQSESVSDDEDHAPENVHPLCPNPVGSVSLKSMFQSNEYRSDYSQTVSATQWKYWNDLPTTQRLEFWALFLTPKQRVKLWRRMQFSAPGAAEYLRRNPAAGSDPDFLTAVWDLKCGPELAAEKVRYQLGVMNCMLVHVCVLDCRSNVRERGGRAGELTCRVHGGAGRVCPHGRGCGGYKRKDSQEAEGEEPPQFRLSGLWERKLEAEKEEGEKVL